MYSIIFLAAAAACAWWVWTGVQARERELGRFRSKQHPGRADSIEEQTERLLEKVGRIFDAKRQRKPGRHSREREIDAKLEAAGLQDAGGRGKFVLITAGCYLCWPLISLPAWQNFTAYYAVVTTVFSLAFLALMPRLWLKRRALERREQIQRELPLFIDLTNLATSAGWDLSSALDKVIAALESELPHHVLVRELRRARWLAAHGYTWAEALERTAGRLQDEGVTRAARSLIQAIEQGGDRSKQLSGIAGDAQRSYYTTLDRRLAGVPVKALLVTMVLFLTYFAILLAPAAVGISGTIDVF